MPQQQVAGGVRDAPALGWRVVNASLAKNRTAPSRPPRSVSRTAQASSSVGSAASSRTGASTASTDAAPVPRGLGAPSQENTRAARTPGRSGSSPRARAAAYSRSRGGAARAQRARCRAGIPSAAAGASRRASGFARDRSTARTHCPPGSYSVTRPSCPQHGQSSDPSGPWSGGHAASSSRTSPGSWISYCAGWYGCVAGPDAAARPVETAARTARERGFTV
ncbi:hypothetical protein ACS04_32550 [Streptomyces roseus]|uniref:Uncharacterized protein n=1 Tax=Streptomyces roseus TaxID=66430 RepID=A0A0J7A954_9ACTN|nr:hypothetical protein ACS04_32550 [Streptomyces roseus]